MCNLTPRKENTIGAYTVAGSVAGGCIGVLDSDTDIGDQFVSGCVGSIIGGTFGMFVGICPPCFLVMIAVVGARKAYGWGKGN